ncbi:MAG: hypothetical protein RBR54_01430 [Sulfurimonas sp.]|jgi:hypothetical protein|nr:hypothetical protein [Sulfurimonas sp.]
MFDFLSSDWFIISIEIVFLVLIVYDVRRYIQTRKKEYVTNIVLTIAFFIWAAIPFYNSYITWTDLDKKEYLDGCTQFENNATLCACVGKEIFKEYPLEDLDKLSASYQEFYDETKEDCLDDSWF